jgi:FkbM family methyltransferase
MRDPRPRIRRLAQLARPAGFDLARSGRAFGRSHELETSLRDQVRSFERAHQYGLQLLPPMRIDAGLVIDIGANEGGFTEAVLAIDPRGRVLAIEPAAGPAEALRRRFGTDSRVRIDTHAVSDSEGTATLNVTQNSVFTSLLEPGATFETAYADTGTALSERTTVPTARLDDLVDEPVSVMKIDVQGAEARLLRGAERTLTRTQAVLMEVTFVSHYDGDTTFPELHAMMLERGFVLRGLGQPYVERGQALWSDACYVPARSLPGAAGPTKSA